MLSTGLLHGELVYLDALRVDDLDVVTAWYSDADTLRNLDAVAAQPQTREQIQGWYEERIGQANAFLFAIRRQSDDDLVGYVELDGILWQHRTSGMAILIASAADRGKGYGRDALQVVMRFAFQELNLHRLQLTVFAYNTPAIALYEHLGFQLEGTFREFLQRDGKRHDMHLYGLLHDEWAQAKEE